MRRMLEDNRSAALQSFMDAGVRILMMTDLLYRGSRLNGALNRLLDWG